MSLREIARQCNTACDDCQGSCKLRLHENWSCGDMSEATELEMTEENYIGKLFQHISEVGALGDSSSRTSTPDSKDIDILNKGGDSGASSHVEDAIALSEELGASIQCSCYYGRGDSHSEGCEKYQAPNIVAYTCDGGKKLCCTQSSIICPNFRAFGMCGKGNSLKENCGTAGDAQIILVA
eukprot:865861_1